MGNPHTIENTTQTLTELETLGQSLVLYESLQNGEEGVIEYATERINNTIEALREPERVALMDSEEFESISDDFRFTATLISETVNEHPSIGLDTLLEITNSGNLTETIRNLWLPNLEQELENQFRSIPNGGRLNRAETQKLLKNGSLTRIHQFISERGYIANPRPSNRIGDIKTALQERDRTEVRVLHPYQFENKETENRRKLIDVVSQEKMGIYTGLQSNRSQALLLIAAVTTENDKRLVGEFTTNNDELPYDKEFIEVTQTTVQQIRKLEADPIEIDSIGNTIDARILIKNFTPSIAKALIVQASEAINGTEYVLTGELSLSFGTLLNEISDMEEEEKVLHLYNMIKKHASNPMSWRERIKYTEEINGVGDINRNQYPSIFALRTLVTKTLGESANSYLYFPDDVAAKMKTPSGITRIWLKSKEFSQSNNIPTLAIHNSTFGRIISQQLRNSIMVRFESELIRLLSTNHEAVSYLPDPLSFIETELENLPHNESLSKIQDFYKRLNSAALTAYMTYAAHSGESMKPAILPNEVIIAAVNQASRVAGLNARDLVPAEIEALGTYLYRFMFIEQSREEQILYFIPQQSDSIKAYLGLMRDGHRYFKSWDPQKFSYQRILDEVGDQIEAKLIYRAMLSTMHHYFSGKPEQNSTAHFLHQGYMLGEHRAMDRIQTYAFQLALTGSSPHQLIDIAQQNHNLEIARQSLESIREDHLVSGDIIETLERFVEAKEALNKYSTTIAIASKLREVPKIKVSIPKERENEVIQAFRKIIPGLNRKATLTLANIMMSEEEIPNPEWELKLTKEKYIEIAKQLDLTWKLLREVANLMPDISIDLYTNIIAELTIDKIDEIPDEELLALLSEYERSLTALSQANLPSHGLLITDQSLSNQIQLLRSIDRTKATALRKVNQTLNISGEIIDVWLDALDSYSPGESSMRIEEITEDFFGHPLLLSISDLKSLLPVSDVDKLIQLLVPESKLQDIDDSHILADVLFAGKSIQPSLKELKELKLQDASDYQKARVLRKKITTRLKMITHGLNLIKDFS